MTTQFCIYLINHIISKNIIKHNQSLDSIIMFYFNILQNIIMHSNNIIYGKHFSI